MKEKSLLMVVLFGMLAGAAVAIAVHMIVRITLIEFAVDVVRSIQQQNTDTDVGADQ